MGGKTDIRDLLPISCIYLRYIILSILLSSLVDAKIVSIGDTTEEWRSDLSDEVFCLAAWIDGVYTGVCPSIDDDDDPAVKDQCCVNTSVAGKQFIPIDQVFQLGVITTCCSHSGPTAQILIKWHLYTRSDNNRRPNVNPRGWKP